MAITGLFTRNRPKIGNLYFDALLEESSELRTEVSEYPLETAETAHDNAVTRALDLSLTIGISDNWYRELIAQADSNAAGLISAGGSITTGAVVSLLSGGAAALAGIASSIGTSVYTGTSGRRSYELLNQLRDIQRAHTVFTLVSSHGEYDNCIIKNTRTQSNKENEGGLEIVVELQRLNIKNSESENVNSNLPASDTSATQGQEKVSIGEVQAS